ncbi:MULTISPECIES: cell wall hydrolase [Paracoccus]|jgi:spore germination cell wall hydrolase CwlJ-like protein|uniref:Cell wall hydrolase n=1 Tax=Paracoccus litorisediminis TaxID=2006130 RepID=A0A844HKW0_9RHOB|nr:MULTISPECIES: cell wall hydrolase [Paracoccus]MBD9525960.1 cell wall hydrolase [Paracoccus sp. PAR01]MTH58411.1 cell wall hydrolase [Paracoccus litorisediminis]
MSTIMSWLARVSLCVALATPAVVAAPATADTKSPKTSDLQCLSEALYFEARGEGHKGQQAVAEVILNRVDHPKFPKSVCGVVNQKGQFTYKKSRIREQGAFNRAQKIAKAALQGAPRNLTNGATYFHTGGVKPSWSRKFERTTRIGSHTFYRSDRRLASN